MMRQCQEQLFYSVGEYLERHFKAIASIRCVYVHHQQLQHEAHLGSCHFVCVLKCVTPVYISTKSTHNVRAMEKHYPRCYY